MTIIEHYAYLTARDHLQAAIDNYRPGHMVFIIGPSGAGKTTLRRDVMRATFGRPDKWGLGRIPMIETFAMLPHSAYFSSRELAIELLGQLHSPALDWLDTSDPKVSAWKQSAQADIEQAREMWEKYLERRRSEGDYWRAVEHSLRARHCRYVCIDQVTALLVNRTNTEPAHHTMHLLSLAEKAGVMFVMTGIYSASRLWEIHSELRRRVHVVFVAPYCIKRRDDEIHFMRLLKTLDTFYPCENEMLLLKMMDEIMAATGGVFAELLQLLDRAKENARRLGRVEINRRDIRASIYNEADLATLWRDVESFEAIMASADVKKLADVVSASWAGSSRDTKT